MAYTIISQNNSTTTLSDGVNTITVPSRVNLTSGNFTIVEVNNNMATLEDGDGNVYRDIPCVATLAGEGGGGGSGLPDQTGHSGEFLTTDGTDASWATISALQNTATGNQSFTVGGTPTNANYSMNIGLNSSVSGDYSLAIGRYATVTDNNSVVIGGGTAQGRYDVVLGNGSIASGRNGSIVIGNSQNITPVEESNVAVFTLNDQNYKILDSDGSIPTDRLIKNSIPHYTIMPAASPDLSGVIAQYVGATDGSYTNGYFYKCSQGTSSATASQTTGSSLSDVAVVVATFETQATDSGSYVFTYSAADSAWIHDYLIADLVDWGITYTGTPVDGDVITVVYDNGLGWTQTDVQSGSSLPSQTGNSGKFLTTDGTDASWSDKPLVNKATGTSSLTLLGTAATQNNAINIGVESYSDYGTISIGKGSGKGYMTNPNIAYGVFVGQGAVGGLGTADCRWSVVVGDSSSSRAQAGIAIGASALVTAKAGIAIGQYAKTSAQNAICLNASGTTQTNSDANTFKVANQNGNFEIMSADGTIPAARHASLPAADGTYVLKLVIASGVPTLSWVAE